jgi:hypothetical protein
MGVNTYTPVYKALINIVDQGRRSDIERYEAYIF